MMLKQFLNNSNSKDSITTKNNEKIVQQLVCYEVFKDHWKQTLIIFNKSLINDDDIQIVKSNLNQMINLLIDELNNINSYSTRKQDEVEEVKDTDTSLINRYGPIWTYVFQANIFENIFLWSLSYPEYSFDLKYEQLKYYECLIYQMQANEQTDLLLQVQLNKPLFSLVNHCSSHNSELIEKIMISVLNQLCVCICKNANLLEIFFQQAKSVSHQQNQSQSYGNMQKNVSLSMLNLANTAINMSSSKFFIFSLLIPYIHKEGCLGQQARDALLMIMQLSARNSNLAKYIVENTDFCPILATGLSGLYSELPQKFSIIEINDEIRYLNREDIINTPSLNKFINSLEFCNNVIQVSHTLIANQLLQYVYYGFLVPVIAPALTQNCIEEIITSTAYLDLFLRTINEPNLLKIFLKFILHAKFDEKYTLLDTLINRIALNTKLSLVTLMLFSTMIDFNSEEVMYKLIFIYLLPCKHLMKSQILTLKQASHEINGLNAQAFLSLSTNFSNLTTKFNSRQNNVSYASSLLSTNETTPLSKWFQSIFEPNELNSIVGYLDGMRFNFVDYLKDAKLGILNSANKSYKWSFNYDISNYAIFNNKNDTKNKQNLASNRQSPELDYDAEEYLLNLNIFTSNLSDPTKSTRSTMNLFSNSKNEFADFDSQSLSEYNNSNKIINEQNSNNNIIKSKRKKNTKSKHRRTTTSTTVASSSFSLKFDDVSTKRQKMRSKRQEKANDFYFLTFDNELSDTDVSDDEVLSDENNFKNSQDNEQEDDYEEEDIDDEEDDLTATSASSTTTLNNNNNSESNEIDTEYRLKLIEYLFSNEENNKLYLNGNLNNFLFALDEFFPNGGNNNQLVMNKLTNPNDKKKLNVLCEQILNIYNDFFNVKTNNSIKKITTTNSDLDTNTPLNSSPSHHTEEYSKDSAVESATLNLTTFPAYAGSNKTSSYHSSTLSLADQIPNDSGINTELTQLTNSMTSSSTMMMMMMTMNSNLSNETDIGPFLCALFNRLDHMLNNSLQINFLLTGLFAKLAYYSQLLLRSFLLNHNLVVQSNIKTLIQVLTNVKFKIEACAKTYNNFSLLYFKAKLFLIKRLIDSKTITVISNQKNQTKSIDNSISFSSNNSVKKKFTMDRFLNFFKPNSNSDDQEFQSEFDLKDTNLKLNRFNNKRSDDLQDDFYMIENEWQDLKTRNIALSAVIYDEFIKELAAICQEHSVLTN